MNFHGRYAKVLHAVCRGEGVSVAELYSLSDSVHPSGAADGFTLYSRGTCAVCTAGGRLLPLVEGYVSAEGGGTVMEDARMSGLVDLLYGAGYALGYECQWWIPASGRLSGDAGRYRVYEGESVQVLVREESFLEGFWECRGAVASADFAVAAYSGRHLAGVAWGTGAERGTERVSFARLEWAGERIGEVLVRESGVACLKLGRAPYSVASAGREAAGLSGYPLIPVLVRMAAVPLSCGRVDGHAPVQCSLLEKK